MLISILSRPVERSYFTSAEILKDKPGFEEATFSLYIFSAITKLNELN